MINYTKEENDKQRKRRKNIAELIAYIILLNTVEQENI